MSDDIVDRLERLRSLVPPGYVIVPLIPTEAMSEAGHEVIARVYVTSDDCPSADDAYAAMLAVVSEPVTIADELADGSIKGRQ